MKEEEKTAVLVTGRWWRVCEEGYNSMTMRAMVIYGAEGKKNK